MRNLSKTSSSKSPSLCRGLGKVKEYKIQTAIMDQKPVTPVEHRCNHGFVVFSFLSKKKKESLLYALKTIEQRSEYQLNHNRIIET